MFPSPRKVSHSHTEPCGLWTSHTSKESQILVAGKMQNVLSTAVPAPLGSCALYKGEFEPAISRLTRTQMVALERPFSPFLAIKLWKKYQGPASFRMPSLNVHKVFLSRGNHFSSVISLYLRNSSSHLRRRLRIFSHPCTTLIPSLDRVRLGSDSVCLFP